MWSLARAASSCYKSSNITLVVNGFRQTRWVSNGSPNTTLSSLQDILADSKSAKPESSLANRFDYITKPGSNAQQTESDRPEFDISGVSAYLQSASYLGDGPYRLHINATFNNTILTLTSPKGQVLASTSGGTAGFKKAARSGYEAAHQATLQLIAKMQEKNLQIVNYHIIFKGFGPGRDAAFKAFVATYGNSCKQLTDATPVPFGGCRPKKARRL